MSTPRDSSTHIQTKNVAILKFVDPQGEVNYPEEWFNKNEGRKPPVRIPKISNSWETLCNSVRGGIRASTMTLKTAKLYLAEYGKLMEGRLSEDWVSFGRKIGEANSSITPLNILQIEYEDEYRPTETTYIPPKDVTTISTSEPSYWTPKALALYLVCIYRLARVSNDDYRNALCTRMEEQLKAEGSKGMSLTGASTTYGNWVNDKNYVKLIAAYDMFLNRFKEHDSSILRLGTLGSRFKDCAALLSVGYAMKILSISAGELMDWIFLNAMGYEMIRLTKENQESGDPYSYFDYQSDLGLVGKSAYSSNANPYVFTWIHIIGSLLGHKRSQNARFIFEGNYADVGLNSVLVAWAHARGGELAPQFDEKGLDYGAELVAGSADPEDEDLEDAKSSPWVTTTGRIPKTWFALAKTTGFKIPSVVDNAIRRQRRRIGEVREDSVGAFVKDKLLY